MAEVKPANLGCFGVADNMRSRLDSIIIVETLLGENHGVVSLQLISQIA